MFTSKGIFSGGDWGLLDGGLMGIFWEMVILVTKMRLLVMVVYCNVLFVFRYFKRTNVEIKVLQVVLNVLMVYKWLTCLFSFLVLVVVLCVMY